jgi:REP element-mobilizing transposase RayT
VDRRHNKYGTSKIAPNSRLLRSDTEQLKSHPRTLDAKGRHVVNTAIREVCEFRKYLLRAINVRTNHVHAVVTAMTKPEAVLIAFQAYSTRALRKAGLNLPGVKPWARHGSTIYLWKERDVTKAMEYVLLGQGQELFKIDDN